MWPKGKPCSQETRRKLSISHLGALNPNYGKHLSSEVKAKISASLTGKSRSSETKAKLSKFFKGRPNVAVIGRKHTQEELEKMRKASLGKKHSPETKAKITASRLGKLNPNYGKPRSPETRARLSATSTGKRNSQWGKRPTPETLRKNLASNQVKPNRQELKLQSILDKYFPSQWKFVGDGQLIIGGLCPDFTNINGKKALIELFGDYWHTKRVKNWTRTELGRIMAYNSYGYKCLVIWEHELKDEEALIKRIRVWRR